MRMATAQSLAVAVAITANAASFLLPTANITSLLLLGRTPVSPLAYLQGSWLAWLLVMAVTIAPLSGWLATARPGPAGEAAAGPSARAVLDLIPMFAAASAIRAILAAGIVLRGGLTAQLIAGSALASTLNNLPTAAVLRPAGTAGLWAAVLATAIGPSLLLTGSVATVICRRIGRQAGVTLRAWQLTAAGLMLVPVQLAAALAGVYLTGALR
jgi:Na+/H+ antiporter NhaD/arsenite permease-like protein